MINDNNKARSFYNKPNIIHRALHDEKHDYNMQSAAMYEDLKDKGLELLIMCLLLSNKGDANNPTDSDWIAVKDEIRSRTGMAVKKFDNAWARLKQMGYIENIGTNTRAQWVVWENKKPLQSPVEQIITVTGDVQTNNNINYNNSLITITGGINEAKFDELVAAYPDEGLRSDGTTYPLKRKLKDSRRLFYDYLATGAMSFDEMMTALKVELNDKKRNGKTQFQPGLYRWLSEKMFEQYKGRVLEPEKPAYGTQLV